MGIFSIILDLKASSMAVFTKALAVAALALLSANVDVTAGEFLYMHGLSKRVACTDGAAPLGTAGCVKVLPPSGDGSFNQAVAESKKAGGKGLADVDPYDAKMRPLLSKLLKENDDDQILLKNYFYNEERGIFSEKEFKGKTPKSNDDKASRAKVDLKKNFIIASFVKGAKGWYAFSRDQKIGTQTIACDMD